MMEKMTLPFSLRIFVADGDPDGLRLVERSNWVGKALVFPRALLPQVKQRPELAQTGVYLLLGPREDGEGDMLYIGEGDPIGPRLGSHYVQKDFWTRAVCLVATPGQLNKAHVQFLEANLIRLAKAAKRLPLENVKNESEPTLSEADRADMQVFLANMLGMLPVLGVHAFEQARVAPIASAGVSAIDTPPTVIPEFQALNGYGGSSGAVLVCSAKGVSAQGVDTTQGFVVMAGSGAALDSGVSLGHSLDKLRRDLLANGVLVSENGAYRFTQDYVFSSPSTAASVVLGRSANGRALWKDAQGRSLKALQAMEAEA